MMEKIKILFLINTLGGGGAEKVLVNLVNNMDSDRFDITVETMFSGGVNQSLLKPHIRYFCKSAFTMKGISKVYRFLPSSYLYKKFIGQRKYDVIVAYMHNLPVKTIIGSPDKATKLIGWCHCGTVEKDTYGTCWHTKKGANRAYNQCDAMVGVSHRVTEELKKFFDIKTMCTTIYNTNDTKRIRELSKEKTDILIDRSVPSICTVGRLSFEKGNDRLINAARDLLQRGYAFNVYIIGDGIEKEPLTEEVKKNHLEENIHFLGFQKNPYAVIDQCDFFVCPSRIEGFSTAVTEAIILNKPVISTDVSGAKEILGENNEYGLVVENSENGVLNGIKTFLDNPSVLSDYQKQATRRAADFETEITVKQAEDLFKTIIQ